MPPEESWETECKEDIEKCLNCTLPDYLCAGLGQCYGRKRRRKGQLESEVKTLVLMEKKIGEMAEILHLSQSVILKAIARLIRKEIITKEQAMKTHIRNSRR